MTAAPERTAPAPGKRKGRARDALHDGLREIYVASAARTPEISPEIVVRDDITHEIERRKPGSPFRGRIYLVWMEHSPDGACQRDPRTDPHEDLGYLGKTIRDLAVRWLEHLAPGKIDGGTGERKRNNSAVYRHRTLVTGFSVDRRVYDSPEALAEAETKAIKALWPAWNIQDQDRRNPHTRASRSHRKPDRLAPLIGIASVLWGLLWCAMTAGLLAVAWVAKAAWYWIPAMPFLALYLVNGTFFRHTARMARRSVRRGHTMRRRR